MALVTAVLAALLFGACSGDQPVPATTDLPAAVVEDESQEEHVEEGGEEHDEGEADHEETEHEEDEAENRDEEEEAGHEHFEVPSEYDELVNPFGGDADVIVSGADLYATTCASCHGPEGKGDGPAAREPQGGAPQRYGEFFCQLNRYLPCPFRRERKMLEAF